MIMRLLYKNQQGELNLTKNLTSGIPKYAILSHTWEAEEHEINFKELLDGPNKSSSGYRKLQFCAQQAEQDELQYFWVDTCSINKESSAELSEAINSMFRWYRDAEKCYAYLSDVSVYDTHLDKAFRSSKWFTRGWTLQELIAPKQVEFFSKEGQRLGDKRTLERQIHEVTGIALEALRGGYLTLFSVEERMAWAKNRATSKEEDQAYCLIGIYDISMPLIYGEGRDKAFLRLSRQIREVQEETQKVTMIQQVRSQSWSNIQSWLSPADVQEHLDRHDEEYMDGSCHWALRNKALIQFFDANQNDILRIGGAPGSGKSTLTAFLIRHIRESITNNVIYFFCKATDDKRDKPFQALRTLLSALLAIDETLYPPIEALHAHSSKATIESFAELQSLIQGAMKDISKSPLFIVVDALDECQDGARLISCLVRTLSRTRGVTKLIITCRDDPELIDAFGYQNMQELIISPDRVREPVSLYIQARVLQCKYIKDPALRRHVHQEVDFAADGSWLFARLMMDEIQRLPSAPAVQRQLKNIPNGLAQLYWQVFATMEKNLTPLELRLSQQVFLWIDMSDFVRVGRDALDREILDIVFQAENSGEEVFDSIDIAKHLCSPLVQLHTMADGAIEISFIHHTVIQFVRECSDKPASELPKILKPQLLKGLYRGNISLWWFENSPKATALLERMRNNSVGSIDDSGEYFEMAYGLWNALWLQTIPTGLEADELDQVSALCDTFTDFLLSGRCLIWIEMAIIINYDGGYTALSENAKEAIEASRYGIASGLPALERFSVARRTFFFDYAYVLFVTGPSSFAIRMPDGFEDRPLAKQILALGQKWSHLHEKNIV